MIINSDNSTGNGEGNKNTTMRKIGERGAVFASMATKKK